MGKDVAVIDYGAGNVWSVLNAFKYLGATPRLVDDPALILKAEFLVLPGVGSFRQGMSRLRESGIDRAVQEAVIEKGKKILGICLGMQLLGGYGTEDGYTEGLGLVSYGVEPFTQNEVGGRKIPHVGFNTVEFNNLKGLFKDLGQSADFYFVHSFKMVSDGSDVEISEGICSYGIDFLAAFEKGNVCGTQFHPEKSQTNGLKLLKNFLES
jgi:glutamine amidotransferase